MGKKRVNHRIVRAAVGIDVHSNRWVDEETDCTYLDLIEDYPTLVAHHSIALTASPREQPIAKRYPPVRSVLSFRLREEAVSAPFRQLWLTWSARKYIVGGVNGLVNTLWFDTARGQWGGAAPDYGNPYQGEESA